MDDIFLVHLADKSYFCYSKMNFNCAGNASLILWPRSKDTFSHSTRPAHRFADSDTTPARHAIRFSSGRW